MPRGATLSSRLKIKEKKKKIANQGVDPDVQIKALIKVFKAKILLGKKNLLWGEISSRSISMDIHRSRMHVQLEHLWIRDHQKWWTSIHAKVKRSDLIFISKFQIIYMYFLLGLGRIRFDLLYMGVKEFNPFIFCYSFQSFEIYICCLPDFLTPWM